MQAPEGSRDAPLDNVDAATVDGFGVEWQRFDYSNHPGADLETAFASYFSLFPWDALPHGAEGFDVGCGSGRWAARVAPRVGKLHCIDASAAALGVARRNLSQFDNCEFHLASVEALPVAEASQDFGYSLGVLHHVPDTRAGIAACVRKLKPGAPFLVYLYYSLDNRAAYYRALWRMTDLARRSIARLPDRARFVVSDVIAATVYWPLARGSRLLERIGIDPAGVPLSWYRDRTFYVMRNDALDRFGTKLEQRFSRAEIGAMLEGAGLERIAFRDGPPYWCAIGYKRR